MTWAIDTAGRLRKLDLGRLASGQKSIFYSEEAAWSLNERLSWATLYTSLFIILDHSTPLCPITLLQKCLLLREKKSQFSISLTLYIYIYLIL